MTNQKLPPPFEQNDAIELFRVLRSLSIFARGLPEDDLCAGEAAAMILLSRLGLAAPIVDDFEGVSWILTVDGNKRLAGLLVELRRWDPDHPIREARRRRVLRKS